MASPNSDGAPSVTIDESATTRTASITPGKLGLAALFAFIVLAQGISAPFQKDAEPQSAEWIQSIVRDGHWLIPRDAYGYIDRKPPLFLVASLQASFPISSTPSTDFPERRKRTNASLSTGAAA